MFQKRALRRLLESCVNETRDPVRGRQRFVGELWATLGIVTASKPDAQGNVEFMESVDELGRPVIAKGAARPEEFSLRLLAESIGGEEWVETYFSPNGGADRLTLLEAGPGIDPTAFLNINTFSLATAGLVEAKVMEKFMNPGFIGDQLVEVRPTRMNGEKMIRIGGIGNKGQTRGINQPHPRASFGEEWVETPELTEKALATEVSQEAVFYDLTGQVLDTAGSVGEELGYLRELEILRMVAGATNSYNYKGTTYNTYQTATPWINDHANVPEDYSDIDNALQLFSQMTDPVTGKEILVNPTTIIHQPNKRMLFNNILNATEVRNTTNTNTVTISPSPITSQFTLLESPIFFNVMQAATSGNLGLGLSASDAGKYWYMGDFKRAFAWMEAWPLRTRQASPNEYVMLDRGLIAAYFSNYRGVGAVKEPRYAVRNKAS